MFISLEHLQKFASVVGGYTLCPECACRYEPALLVELRGVEKEMHFAPVPHMFWSVEVASKYQPPFCNPLPKWFPGWWEFSPPLGGHGYLFLKHLVRRYPALLDRPLTERVLREVGCDVETEWALWQLGNQWV